MVKKKQAEEGGFDLRGFPHSELGSCRIQKRLDFWPVRFLLGLDS
jgi:hypothetical protein